ncbi:unnamed protein product [Toxocara canis]|uniref:BTB domain-containing protein n=1 Tax=Toxocara canis TaxID=6265 RepID=A0A183VEU8_TOXCA|nr:unnamed protein product [Toxocara canis]
MSCDCLKAFEGPILQELTKKLAFEVHRNASIGCSSYDFTDPCSDTADCALVVEGVKLYVSRAYLALYSPVFYAIFFAKFSGCRGKREVQLDGVILEELIELLDVIYPSHKPVTGENVEFLLKLGDRFEIQFVIDECEHFLIESDEVAIVTKLYWADQYRLVKLQVSLVFLSYA